MGWAIGKLKSSFFLLLLLQHLTHQQRGNTTYTREKICALFGLAMTLVLLTVPASPLAQASDVLQIKLENGTLYLHASPMPTARMFSSV
jgi:hypothetical protein